MATERIDVTYRVVTPLFGGGATPQKAELRLTSFKGVLRWWWRALAWSRCEGDLLRIAAGEDEVFGSAHSGQGKVTMRLLPGSRPTVLSPPDVLRQTSRASAPAGEGARYLGYGVVEAFARQARGNRLAVQAGQLTRACLLAPFDFKVEVLCRHLDGSASALLLDSLRAIGMLGGMGSKSRKGYGSLALQYLAVDGVSAWSPPQSAVELAATVRSMYSGGPGPAALPSYTAISPHARHVLVEGGNRTAPLELLDRVGREMMRYRSWGHDGKVLGSESEKHFRDDHDPMKQPSSQRRGHPRRIVFGLPHNYGKASDQQVGPADDRTDRRASPLLIHVHECGQTPVAVLTFLPAQFLPGGDAAAVNVGGRRVAIAADAELWSPVGELLDRFLGQTPPPKERKEPFGQTLEVRP